MWTIKDTTGSVRYRIVHAETYYRVPDQLATALYLAMNLPFKDRYGNTIQLNHERGNLRNDKKPLRLAGLPSQTEISEKNGGTFIHAFIANNWSTSTPQQTFQGVLAEAIKSAVGFDFDLVTPANLADKNLELQALLQDKDLEARWSKWVSPYNNMWCWGPNGDSLAIV